MSSCSVSTSLHRNRWIHLAFGLAVSIVCLWFAARELLDDPEAFSKTRIAFERADYRTLIPIALATGVFYWFKALRWRLLLKPVGDFRTSRDLFPFVMIGFGFNNILPVHMGEIVRVLLFSRRSHVKLSTAAASVVLERIFDSISVLTLLSFGLLFVQGLSETIRTKILIVAGCVSVLVVFLLLYVFCTQKFIALVRRVLSPIIATRWIDKLTRTLESGASGLAALKQPHLVAGILALSLGSWVINGIVIHLALLSFGLPNSLLISCIVLGLTAVFAALPSAPGYLGMIQLSFVMVLDMFTEDQASVFAASIYYHMTEYVIVTLTGLAYFSTMGVSLAEVEAEAEAVEKQPSGNPDLVDVSGGSGR